MKRDIVTNLFVIKFANVNGTGSASANKLFSKSVFRMGVPISPKNIFPSNIQGLPTWYEVRINENGFLGRRGGIDVMVGMNPQSMERDIAEVEKGGYFVYDSTKPLNPELKRDDIDFIGLPLMEKCREMYEDPRQRQLFRNIMYVGSLAALFGMKLDIAKQLIAEQFKGKEKIIEANCLALQTGYDLAKELHRCPIAFRIETRDKVGNKILIDGNEACGLGAVYGGATVSAWYPITPSTSVIDNFARYCRRFRMDPETGQKNFAIVQAEDELAAIGMVIGASWNGARAFTATSGPGLSLMNEFLGLAYFAEIPTVLVDVQRAGPSTGMPTRTQQSDVLSAAYASHGDTKHICLYPSTPKECFELTATAFDLAERFQTPILILSDLDLGMNDNMSEPFDWDDAKKYDRGKVYSEEDLENMTERFGRYLDVDGDGIPYRTYPGTHPTKGAFFTRGTSKDDYAVYTEIGEKYIGNMERIMRKWETASKEVPKPVIRKTEKPCTVGVVYYGTSEASTIEALHHLNAMHGISLDSMGIKSFPFSEEVGRFIDEHEYVFVVEQNRDAQMRTLLINEYNFDPEQLVPLLHYDGSPITARYIRHEIRDWILQTTTAPRRRSRFY
ncbi:2-oxoacid:acceptor oxidoreductase subunit alpha [Pontiella sulfatireligans]|uniref:2-oxoglutarate oxidoreductase subunit KorA n=1 Tax=Pontiella sulfatireligans TaxID=2750658 RepID=A0A6C2UIY4_9BACT|nr:2-oxoacid:acceptor oxidoreductase subunit alpha [Pontiella sulfatireligans]VGO20182.1 2-oxoglutarate oxidoreductase subunit KorA [Pontiella sulfatireligans]